MTRLAVIGPGLLGGSIALAARRAGNFRVAVWARRPDAVQELRDKAIRDERDVEFYLELPTLALVPSIERSNGTGLRIFKRRDKREAEPRSLMGA